MRYLLHLAIAILTVNSWAVCRITDPLQDGGLSCIRSSYDEDSESDFWTSMAGLFGSHLSDGVTRFDLNDRCMFRSDDVISIRPVRPSSHTTHQPLVNHWHRPLGMGNPSNVENFSDITRFY